MSLLYPPPRLERIPERVGSLGKLAAEVVSLVGINLDAHQQHVMDIGLSLRRSEEGGARLLIPGKEPVTWASTQFGLSEPRQNGKSELFLARKVFGALYLEEPRIIFSAHEVKTSIEQFNKLRALCENYDVLRKRVKRVTSTNGREGIEFLSGSTVNFLSRTKGSGRGFSASTILLDEAQELSFTVFAAILPTLSAIPNSQLWMGGTPPSPEMNGEVFTRARNQAIARGNRFQAWVEWGGGPKPDDIATGTSPRYDASDPEEWKRANPACPSRIPLSAIEAEYSAMDDDTFRRDRLAEWDTASSGAVVPAQVWSGAAAKGTEFDSNVVLVVDIDPARANTSISAAAYTDGSKRKRHMRLVASGPGTDWAVSMVRDLVHDDEGTPIRAVLIDAAGPAASLVAPMKGAGVAVTLLNTRDMTSACGQMYDGFMNGSYTHDNQDAMTAAMQAATWRPLGDARALSRRRSETNISPFVSGTLALYGVGLARVKRPRIGERGRRKVSVKA